MSRVAAILFCLLFCALAHGQTPGKCPEYEKCLERALNFLKSRKLEEARREYSTAKIFAKECGISDTLAEKGILAVIDSYKMQTANAERARKEAIKQKNIAEKTLKEKERLVATATPIVEKYANKEEKKAYYLVAQVKEVDNSPLSLQSNGSTSKKNGNINKTIPAFIKWEKTINSLLSLHKEGKISISEGKDIAHMENIIGRLEADIRSNSTAKKLTDSTKRELEKLAPGTSQYDFTVYTYLRASLYSAWYWTEKEHKDIRLAKTLLDDAAAYCRKSGYRSAIIYSGMASLYNGYQRYYSTIGDEKRAFDAIKTAIDYATLSVDRNSGNYLYQRGLAVLIRNATYIPDSLLSVMEKVEVARLSYQCLKNMELYFPYEGNSLTELCNSSQNLSNRLMNAGYYTQAADTLKNTLGVLNQYIAKGIAVKGIELNKLKLLINASAIYVNPAMPSSYKSAFYYLDESYRLFNNMNLRTSDNDNIDRLKSLNESLNDLLKYAKSKKDSLSAITLFSSAIQVFEKIRPLESNRYRVFSEDVYRFAQPYARRLELNIMQDNKKEADRDFAILEKTFFPYYNRYRFDFYLGQTLIQASKLYANYLCKQGNYKQALPLLKFTSLEGIKGSTDSLITIYQKPGFANEDSLQFYKNRTSYQSDGMKKFTIPVEFNGVKQLFHIYVMDRGMEYDTLYMGIRDQERWIREARGGKVPDDVMSSFDKLLKIAWENNVSFMDLTAYALGALGKEPSSNKTSEVSTTSKVQADIDKKIKNKTVADMLITLQSYVTQNDTFAIRYITDQIKHANSVSNQNSEREKMYYFLLTEQSVNAIKRFKKERVSTYRDIFLSRSPTYFAPNNVKREYYLKLTTLDSLYYSQSSSEITGDSVIGAHYNSLAWYSLLTQQFDKVHDYLMLSKKFDPQSIYPDSNIPLYYLLTNQIKKAKAEYMRLKDKPFLPGSENLQTYKLAFLSDLEEFEKEGIYNKYFEEIRRLLNK